MSTMSIQQIHDIIDNQIPLILQKEGIQIMNYAKKIIDDIYNSYSPFAYERTYELYDSMKMKIVKEENEWVLQVYIDDKKHSYNPTWKYNKPSTYAEIFEKFKKGFYGRDKGYDVMGGTKEEWIDTGKAIEFFINEMQKKFKILRF